MARENVRSRAHKLMRWAVWAAVLVSGTAPIGRHSAEPDASAWAQDLSFSAKVDKTTVDVGEPITLTMTVSGDATGIKLPPPELPEGFVVVAQSQSTNFAIRAGAAERSTSLVYVLVARRAGSFQLGPFELTRRKQTITTEPINITVKKPAVPPHIKSHGERFTL